MTARKLAESAAKQADDLQRQLDELRRTHHVAIERTADLLSRVVLLERRRPLARLRRASARLLPRRPVGWVKR